MKHSPTILASSFYLALGTFLGGIALLFTRLIADSAWWLIAVVVFGGAGALLMFYALATFAAALDHLLRDVQEHRRQVERADSEAEAAYWLAVARAKQLGISVAGYLRRAGYSEDEIVLLEIARKEDLNGDGAIGRAPFPDLGINIPEQRKRVRKIVENFVVRSWRTTMERGHQPTSNASGVARSVWVGQDVPEPYRMTREEHDDIVRSILPQMRLFRGRGPGNEGFFTLDSVDEVLRVIHDDWHYVRFSPCWDKSEPGAPASQPASEAGAT